MLLFKTEEHEDIAKTLSNIGSIHFSMNDKEEAKKYFLRALGKKLFFYKIIVIKIFSHSKESFQR